MPEGSDRGSLPVYETDVRPAMEGERRVTKSADDEEEVKIIIKTAAAAALVHPFNYAQLLMQIGYEPLPARLGQDFFGKPVYYLGSVFDYLRDIWKQSGFTGLFYGLRHTLLVAFGGLYAYRGAEALVNYVYDEKYLGRASRLKVKRFRFLEARSSTDSMALRCQPGERIGISYTNTHFAEDLTKEVVIVTISTAATWPLQVIAFRTMAQFIGRETLYDRFFDSVREILNTEGIAGFFKGLLPTLFSYVSITVITYSSVYAYANYNKRDPLNLRLVAAAVGAVANSYFYPLKLVGRLMAVSGARLTAARPPRLPAYKNWRDLHGYLISHNEEKRGSSMLWRKIPAKNVETTVKSHDNGMAYRMSSQGTDGYMKQDLMTSFLTTQPFRI